MERDGKNTGASRRDAQVTPPAVVPPPAAEDEDLVEDEPTNPGIVDPAVQEAIQSLRRVQVETTKRASDFALSLVRKRTPFPR